MLVLNRIRNSERTNSRTTSTNPDDGLRALAVGLGTLQLLLDIDQAHDAREALRCIRNDLQALRRSRRAAPRQE
jgi:hypothetical protein